MSSVSIGTEIIQLADQCERLLDEHGKAAALSFLETRGGFDLVETALRSDSEILRRKALYLLSLWPPRRVVKRIADILESDSSPVVRHEAAFFLGVTHAPEALQALAIALRTDCSDLVRHEAAEAIGDLGVQSGLRVLSEAEDDPSLAVRDTVRMAISQLRMALQPKSRE